MKRILVVVLTSLALSAFTFAQITNGEQTVVQQTIQNLFTALSNRDCAGLRSYCTPDVHFYEYGRVWTIDTLIQKVMQSKSIPDFKRTNRFEFVNTTISKTTSFTTYYLQSTITKNGKEEIVNWMETVVLQKEKKNWKVSALHSTRLPKN